MIDDFLTADDYHQLNAGAHRRTSLRIQAPALSCHMGLWKPEKASRSEWVKSIENCILNTIPAIQTLDDGDNHISFNSCFDDCLILFHNCYDRKTLRQTHEALSGRKKDIKDSDYRNIFFEKSVKFGLISFSYELHSEYVTISILFQLNRKLMSFSDDNCDSIGMRVPSSLSEVSKHLQGDSNDLDINSSYLFIEFWNDIVSRFVLINSYANATSVGRIFADFRGIIISDETRAFGDQTFLNEGTRSRPRWANSIIERIQVIIGDRSRHEITASYMLAGRALYLTNLGPQLPEADLYPRIPTKYILYVHQKDLSAADNIMIVNKWQLGRLIDRLHWLGIHRLAAIKSLPELRKASQSLARLSEIDVDINRNSSFEVEKTKDNYRKLRRDLRALSISIEGGLLYRTERSRYYVSNFRRMVDGLRIVRIEGYQPYDQFIERRLGSTFAFIDRLGVRYERALATLSRLRFDAIMDELMSIQIFGEIALLLGLLPYYITHILTMADIFHSSEKITTIFVWVSLAVCYLFYKLARGYISRRFKILALVLIIITMYFLFLKYQIFDLTNFIDNVSLPSKPSDLR